MSDTIIVNREVDTVVVNTEGGETVDVIVNSYEVTAVVSEAVQGPTGPQGPAGPAGAGGFDHTQATPASEWVVNHNLGFRPSVEILNAGGSEVEAEVLHMSVNQVRLYFTMALAGSARCV